MSILLSWAQTVHQALLAVVMALHPIQCNPIKIWSPLLFHDQDTASPPFPQRKELVAQVARIYWPHLINATLVQPGSLFLSLHFITAFVIMQAPRHPFLEARALSQSSIWFELWVMNFKFWYWVSVLGVLVLGYISFWPLLGPLGNATHWGRSRKCLAIVCVSYHLPLQSTRK